MKHILLCCTASALLGGAIAAYLVDDNAAWAPGPVANAQLVEARSQSAPYTTTTSISPNSDLTPEELINIRVYEGASRGVVNILTRTVSYDRFFMLPSPGEGAGSGSVLDKRGHILTNYHVIEDVEEIQVTLPGADEEYYEGKLVGVDPENDIAVLKIDAPPDKLFPVPLGTSNNLHVGQRVFTLGNPFGLEGTLTTGIVSSLNRTLPNRLGRTMKSIIQTDAAMNPGNSGGPLLDTRGRMIGMNVAIASKSGQSAGLGFAIPVNRIRQSVTQLIEHGEVIRADIGIVAVAETEKGLQIVQLNDGGPAERAGLRGWGKVQREVRRGPLVYTVERNDPSAADVIVALDGEPVKQASTFVEEIDRRQPGEQVVLTIIREGRQMQVPVTLGTRSSRQ